MPSWRTSVLFPSVALLALAVSTSVQAAPAKKVVGYYPQWGMFNTPAYNAKNVITSGSAPLLTHLIYAFSDIQDNRCATGDVWADTKQPLPASLTIDGKADVEKDGVLAGNFHQLKELKVRYPNLHIMISIGGSGMPESVLSQAGSPLNRKAFVASCIAMYIKGQFASGITQPGIFTGIDIDWEFPKTVEDKNNYVGLLQEFRTQLNALGSGYQLSTVGGTWWGQWDYMDPDAVQNIVDFFNLSLYGFDGPWNSSTGFVAPLYRVALDPTTNNNVDYVVQAYLAMGVEADKIVMGMPFYGYHWTSVTATDEGLFQPGVADQTEYPYRSIAVLTGYNQYRDSTTKSPWLHKGSTKSFWTFEDSTSLALKAEYATAHGLGGVMFWELSGDTPSGTLIKSVAAAL